ncbi:chorismate mutase [Heyndrickxia sporothermodurans]|uniref:chorismate mutase n=1 Tax=Heyndrickxia sporothermodurans TaxID=46224 RepID=A0A150LAF7_9BACI|nr:chorismate mutase [Heyndrickxia sporothermodurans]KYD09264.1 Chorismate mutase II [Heyndrickxia sporothermodurans]
MIRGVRGATTVSENKEKEIIEATETLVQEMIEQNNLEATNVASVFISVTDDIDATFPAKALRGFPSWIYVPVMCMKEINVDGGLPLCIRIMMHINTESKQHEINHVYLKNTKILRPDLQKNR